MVEEALLKKVDVRIDGKAKKRSQIEVGLMQLITKATTGDHRSIIQMLESGKHLERRNEERAGASDTASNVAPPSDSDRSMMEHFFRSQMLEERFAPDDVDVALRIFGMGSDEGDAIDE